VRGKEYLALKDRTMMSSPTPTFFPSNSFSSSTSSTVASFEELDLPTLYDHQRKYVAALSKQISEDDASSTQNLSSSSGLTKEASISSVSTVSTVSVSTKSGTTLQFVTLKAPTTIKLDPEPQGPFRFQPAPAPTSTPEWDEMATDILYSCPFTDEVNKSTKLPLTAGLLLVAFADGRVDVCLDLVKVEAVWSKPVS
jgi:nucleoporin NUP82